MPFSGSMDAAFCAETINAGNAVAEPPENKTGGAEVFIFSFALPSTQGSPTITSIW
jgi:hypothetical protein